MRSVVGVLVVSFLLCGALLAQTGQKVSLADLAIAKHDKKAVKIFTEDDLPQQHHPEISGNKALDGSQPKDELGSEKTTASTPQKKTSAAPTPDELKTKIAEYQQEKTVWNDSVEAYQDK